MWGYNLRKWLIHLPLCQWNLRCGPRRDLMSWMAFPPSLSAMLVVTSKVYSMKFLEIQTWRKENTSKINALVMFAHWSKLSTSRYLCHHLSMNTSAEVLQGPVIVALIFTLAHLNVPLSQIILQFMFLMCLVCLYHFIIYFKFARNWITFCPYHQRRRKSSPCSHLSRTHSLCANQAPACHHDSNA